MSTLLKRRLMLHGSERINDYAKKLRLSDFVDEIIDAFGDKST